MIAYAPTRLLGNASLTGWHNLRVCCVTCHQPHATLAGMLSGHGVAWGVECSTCQWERDAPKRARALARIRVCVCDCFGGMHNAAECEPKRKGGSYKPFRPTAKDKLHMAKCSHMFIEHVCASCGAKS